MVNEKLQKVLHDHLPEADADKPLGLEDELVSLGIDSLRLVELIIGLEESLDIVIPDEEMTAKNFSTVGTVTALVDRLSAG